MAKGLELNAGMSAEVVYDSNILRSNSNIQADQIGRATPVAVLLFEPRNYRSKLHYLGEYSFHRRYTGEDTQKTLFDGLLGWYPGEFLNAGVRAGFADAFDQRGAPEAGIDPSIPLASWTMSSYGIETTLPVISGKLFSRFDADRRERLYDGSTFSVQNNNINRYFGELGYIYSGKTFFVLNYVQQYKEYVATVSKAGNSQTKTLSAGMRWKTTGKSTNYLLLGAEQHEYPGLSTSYVNWSIDLSWRWRRKSFSHITLAASRHMLDDVKKSDFAYINNDMGLSISHFLTRKVYLGIGAHANINQYIGKRDDLIVSMQGEISHRIFKHLKWGLRSRFGVRNSTNNLSDYSFYQFSMLLEAVL